MKSSSPRTLLFTTASVVMFLCSFAALQTTNGATTYTFNNMLTGSQDWSTILNWAPSGSPGSTGTANGDFAIIAPASGSLNVTSPSVATTIGNLSLTGSAGNALTFTLGNDLQNDTFTVPSTRPTIVNTSGVASNMVIDLNGHNLSLIKQSGGNNYGFGLLMGSTLSMNITSSSGGTFTNDTWGGASYTSPFVNIQGNATVRVQLGGGSTIYASGTTFSSGSTFIVAGGAGAPGTGVNFYANTANALGNLTFGDTVTGKYTDMVWQAAAGTSTATVVGNFSLLGGKVNMALGQYSAYVNTVKIGGNFTDQGGSVQSYNGYIAGYGSNNLKFSMNGGSGTEHTLSINRTLNYVAGDSGVHLVTNFEVGDGTTAGNVKLENVSSSLGAVNTSGDFRVRNGSRLNIGTTTTGNDTASLKAGSITIDSGATVAWTFGTHSGFALADTALGGTGTLTLNTFNLELAYDFSGDWISGNDLLLFSYTNFVGTPALGTVTLGSGIASVGVLYNTDSGIYLSDVQLQAVPEPSTVFFLMASFGGFIIWKLRRRTA
ncbi:MAG: hypothetical protein ABIP97_10245 [Chthoniobacterales bacterium]